MALALLGVGTWLFWRFGAQVTRALLFPSPQETVSARAGTTDIQRAQQVVRASFPAAGLIKASQAGEQWVEQKDSGGEWRSYRGTWELPEGQDPNDAARRLRSLVLSEMPDAEVYVVPMEQLDVEVRVYTGNRLASHIHLRPTLSEWPALPEGFQPMLALVMEGFDNQPQGAREVLEVPRPMGLLLKPFSPFTLRLARDAVANHKETLVDLETGQRISEALQAVPHASGIVLREPPPGDPAGQAITLRSNNIYVLDVTPAGLPATWIRALADAGVATLSVVQFEPTTRNSCLRRLRHMAARDGAATLLMDVESTHREEVMASFAEAEVRGYRITFAAEVAERMSTIQAPAQ